MSPHTRNRRAALALVVAVAAAPAGARAQASASVPAAWDVRFSNPKQAAGDFTLPLPCGGAIVFRPVAVPSPPGALDDRAIQLGNPDAQLGFNEYQRAAFLAAPFRAADGTRVFYLGKYDITQDQYAAVTGPGCPLPSPHGRTAQASVSWFDAVAFTERLSVWLLANAADKLPQRDQSPAFVRLPTEAEWEYAARGGVAVSESDYLAPTWPMPEGIERYAVAGAGMADGHAQQVGQLLPNPLGLYDMLGNVEQWVLEPYRLNRVGRLLGLPGGLVSRGGSFATPPEDLRTSMRTEIPPYDPAKQTPTRLGFVGFRVLLSAVSGGGLQDVATLRQAFATLQASNAGGGGDPGARIAQLKELTPDLGLRRALDVFGAQLAADDRARADAARQTVRADLNAATALCYVIWRVQRIIAVQQSQLENSAFRDLQTDEMVKRVRAAIAGNQVEQQTALDAYGEILRQAMVDGALHDLKADAAVVAQDMAARADRRRLFVAVTAGHLAAMGAGRAATPDAMLQDIIAVPAQ
jgi:formylglycine-generating enzyme required for sulfatase activity